MNEISQNKRAHYDYEILETYEAGVMLHGFEAKAAKSGRMNIAGSYAVIRANEAWLLNATISSLQPKNTPSDYDPARSRKLLLRSSEIKELIGKTAQKGLTLVPVRGYTKRGKVKILIGLGRSKKKGDKRETIKKRDVAREIERNIKE